MVDPVAITVASSLASAVFGSALTYVTTVLKVRQDLAAKYDSDLRRDRIGVYRELWKALEPLAKYAPPAEFTFSGANRLAVVLRAWYFEKGGLFLSDAARDAYFALQETLKTVGKDSDDPVVGKTLDLLKAAGSALRTRLSQDVGTRAKAMVKY